MTRLVTVTGFAADHGTLVELVGVDDDHTNIHFLADHRCAQTILDALTMGVDPVVAEVPAYCITYRRRRTS